MKPSNSLIKSITDNGLKDILADIGEISLESIAKNEAVDKIPVIGWVKGLYSIGRGIQDHFFIQKLLLFLNELYIITEIDRAKIKARMENDEKFEQKVGERLLGIIIRMDDIDKAKIIAKLFATYIDGKISYDSFCRYAQVVNNSFLPDLVSIDWVKSLVALHKLNQENADILIGTGLLKIKTKSLVNLKGAGAMANNNLIEYYLNASGVEFFEIIKEK